MNALYRRFLCSSLFQGKEGRRSLSLSRFNYCTIVSRRGHTTTATKSTKDDDFAHHTAGLARLNHASFGAVPRPVLDAQDAFRREWLAGADELYFTGRLHDCLRQAAAAGAQTIHGGRDLDPAHVCLLENATVATCAVANYWSKHCLLQPGHDVILHFDVAYKACINILKEYCTGARLVPLHVPFPVTTADEILSSLRTQLQDLHRQGLRPRFAFLDHVSSQPCLLLPLAEIIALVRKFGTTDMQVCVDGAHAVGSVPDMT